MQGFGDKQLKRQDFVDNQIYALVKRLIPPTKKIEWDIEMIADIRDTIQHWLGYKGEKNYWLKGEDAQKFAFNELVQHLEETARGLEKDHKDAICLKVFGINFKKPT